MPQPNFDKFTFDSNYTLGYAETDDPRILAIIERDEHFDLPDGDCFAPAMTGSEWRYGGRFTEPVSTVWQDDDAVDAVRRAWDHWGYDFGTYFGDPDSTAARWLRIFHGITVHLVTSSSDQYAHVWVIDSPAFRTAMGIDPAMPTDEAVKGDVETWQAALDGDVYGIGYAVSHSRTTTETPVDLDDPAQGWEVNFDCWGFFGDEYAATSALSFDYGNPDLHPMLDGTDPATTTTPQLTTA